MKKLLLILISVLISSITYSQGNTESPQDTNTYRIIKTDGTELIAKVISSDAREMLVLTKDNRQIYIPQHVIKELVLLKDSEVNQKGNFIGEDQFSTRYFFTTNGLPIKKGEHYVQWNLFGPDFQFSLGNNVGMGFMTSWFGVPLIGTIKKSWEVGYKTQLAVGGLVGSGSWASPYFGLAVPYVTMSVGDRSKNIALSYGYGNVWSNGIKEGRSITSIAGMIKVSAKISLIFDSFILLPQIYNYGNTAMDGTEWGGILIPGVRWHQGKGKAFQFGFSNIISGNGNFDPIPFPMVQWYRTL